MSNTIYPKADVKTQDWSDKYVGSKQTPNVLVLHSTEGTNWPSYNGGASAPHFTVMPDFANQTVVVRQHFPVDRSARALVNSGGGVETNTLNIVQVEMVGTCSPRTHGKWGNRQHIYMPEAPDWFVAGVAGIVRWLHNASSAFPIKDGTPRGFLAYPGSYGNTNGQRMSFSEWNDGRGIVGHQHVPENAHGDPGAFDIARLVAFAKGEAAPSKPVVSTNRMDPNAYFIGATGGHVTWLGERLEAHGFGNHYNVGPGPNFGEADLLNVSDFQHAQGWEGDDANGLPGTTSLSMLAADPESVSTVEVVSAIQNMAGNNPYGIETAKARMRRYVAARRSHPIHILNAQETTVASTVRPRLDKGLGALGYERAGGGKGRYCYARGVEVVDAGLFTVPSKWWFRKDDKQAAWVVYDIDGARGMDVSMHLEYRSGRKADGLRVEQAQWIANAALSKADALSVPEQNVMLSGDTNSEGMVLDALADTGWHNAAIGSGYEESHTFMGWDGRSLKRFDYALVRVNAIEADLEALSHNTSISDHAGLRVRRQLIK